MKSKTNSVTAGKYFFQPKRYDKDNNLICTLYRKKKCFNPSCKLTGVYKFDTNVFEVLWVEDGWLTNKHKKLFKWFLKQYDWI